MIFTGFLDPFGRFLALDPTKKVFEHFLIDILCCLNILNKISKIEEEKTYFNEAVKDIFLLMIDALIFPNN